MKNDGIAVLFKFQVGADEKFEAAVFPCAPRVGDKVKGFIRGGGVYEVKSVAFVVNDTDSSSDLPSATIEVELAPLDEVSDI